MCIVWRSYNFFLSTMGTAENWRLSQCGKALPYSREIRTIARSHPARTTKMIEIRTLLLTRICINIGLNIVKNRHEWQRENCTMLFSKSAGAISWTGISLEEREFTVDSGASVHMMSKSDLAQRQKETIRKSKESCTVLTAKGTITATEEATLYFKDLDMFITVQLLEDSPAVLSLWR